MQTRQELAAIHPEAVRSVRAQALDNEHVQLFVDTFQALAVATRVRLIHALLQQPLCVRDLAIVLGLSESAVSHQLRFLRDRRVVKARRAGKVMYYAVDDQHVAALLREADHHIDHVRRGLPDHPQRLNGDHQETEPSSPHHSD